MDAQFRYGDTNPVVAPVDADTVIQIGDLVYYDTDNAKPAGYDSAGYGQGDLWDTNIAGTQEAFHDLFIGVAAQRSRDGDAEDIRVSTTGVFEFDCAAATFELGALVGPAKTSGNNIENQKVVGVATANLAIGRVAKRYAANTTRVLVAIESVVMHGGVQAPA